MSAKPMTTDYHHPPKGYIRLPDRPDPEDMNNYLYFHSHGNALHLAEHFGNQDTTIILSDGYIAEEPTSSRKGLLLPDLLIAFGVDPIACRRRNGYLISEQGKPPDFVLEIGSKKTGRRDRTVKRAGYAKLGIPEYWRFDPSGGEYHGAPLAGDRLVGDAYQPIPILEAGEGALQGYSPALDLYLRWDHAELYWYDPATDAPILTYHNQRDRADDAEARADNAEARAESAEARLRELEAELERRRHS